MAERVELPRLPAGEPEAQLQELYNYLYRLAETLNANLAEIGNTDLTDSEREILNSLNTGSQAEAGDGAGYNWQEAETLKSLIIKTASFVKNTLDTYRINLLGEYVADGKFGKYVRNTRMDVEVTPTGTTQNFKFSEIIAGLKEYEINAKNYIKTGLLRTESSLPVYGIAVGKDVVTFSQDGTETYNDGNKVAEFTADALSFFKSGVMTAKYAGTATTFYIGGQVALKIEGNRVGFYNNGVEKMYITNGKLYVTDLDGYSTTSQMNTAISNQATSTENAAKNYTNTQLGSYSTTSQMNTAISNYVNNNAYKLVSGISIASAGVGITGSKYISMQSGCYITIGDWTYNNGGAKYKVNNNSWFVIGTADPWESGKYCHRIVPTQSGIEFIFSYPLQYDPSTKLEATATLTHVTTTEYDEVQLSGGNYMACFECSAFEGSIFAPTANNAGRVGGDGRKFGQAWINYIHYWTLYQESSRNIKHNILPMPEMGEKLDRLEPVTFVYDEDQEEKTRYGLIYEDTIDVMPEICTGDEGQKAINYMELVPMLLKEIQDLRRRVKQLEEERS